MGDFDSARVCDTCFEALEKELGNVESLRNKFKKREIPRSGRYADRQRLKISSVENNAQMSGYLRKKQKNGAKWKRIHLGNIIREEYRALRGRKWRLSLSIGSSRT